MVGYNLFGHWFLVSPEQQSYCVRVVQLLERGFANLQLLGRFNQWFSTAGPSDITSAVGHCTQTGAMPPRVPELTTCCFYFSLKTGAKFFGFFTLLTSSFAFLILAVIFFHHFFSSEDKNEPNAFTEFLKSCILDLVVHLAQIVTSVVLLLGAYQEKGRLLPPWLVTSAVAAFCELFFLTTPLTIHLVGPPENTFPGSWLWFNATLLVDDLYGWLVVYNYYRTLTPRVS